MRKSISIIASIVLLAFVSSQALVAQSNKEETEFFQSIFGMEKKAAVASFIQLEEGDAFWTLYDEYETERKELGKKRLEELTAYAENYESLNDEAYDALIKTMISLRKQNDKLTDAYYKKIKKASGSKVAGQFFQVESYFLSQIRALIMQEIPYIGEFDN